MTAPSLDELFRPWQKALGRDYRAYRNHAERVLRLCELLAGGALPDPLAFHVAATYHDLGIWSDGTLDYLAPSRARASAWLAANGLVEKSVLVEDMIENHHRVRAAGPGNTPVEIFRQADWIDVTLGLCNFGLAREEYRRLLDEFPDAGFHRRLLELGGRQWLRTPWRPLPMFRL